jgi:hypothetical protein
MPLGEVTKFRLRWPTFPTTEAYLKSLEKNFTF